MNLLSKKVAIITGASSGIGRATAKLFAQEGARVVLSARQQDDLNPVAEEIRQTGGIAIAIPGDITMESYAKDLVDLTVDTFGGLDIAFNNAGTLGAYGATTDITLDQWNATITTNLTSAFLAAKYQLPVMTKPGGSIIFTSSFVGYTLGMPQIAAYAASKAGMIGLTKALASEYGPGGIRVNALLPGATNTKMAKEHMSHGFNNTSEAIEFIKNIHALKRMATPEEIAQSALYLASDMSSFTTGAAMLTDGGVSVSRT